MDNDEQASAAISELNDCDFNNSRIVVKEARPREEGGRGKRDNFRPRRNDGGGQRKRY